MTEQQTPDREKKIAEILEGYKSERDDNFTYKKEIVEQDIRFLLSELERLEREYAEERAAHNAHVTELCELEQERNMYKASSEVFYERLKKVDEQRNKLIEVLRWYADTKNYEYRTSYLDQDAPIIDDSGQRARDILREVGVTVE